MQEKHFLCASDVILHVKNVRPISSLLVSCPVCAHWETSVQPDVRETDCRIKELGQIRQNLGCIHSLKPCVCERVLK